METQLDVSGVVPRAPGYIMAPTTFTLEGHPEDFIDWDEESNTPEEDHWADEPNYWILVFRAYPEKQGNKSVILDSEICVDILGQHRCVPLDKHWGSDIRPAAAHAAGSILHAWGWRYPDSQKRPYDLYVHWILASPFQLAWSSLPPMNAKDRSCDWTTFEKWAARRGLEHTFLTSEELRKGKVVVPVASTWREGFARNRELVAAIARTHPSLQKCSERLLYDLVDLALHQNPNILPHLNKARFDAYGDELTKQDQVAEESLIQESVKLNSFLDGKRYAALKHDAASTKEIGAWKKMLVIMARIFREVAGAPLVTKRLPEMAATITDYLKTHYDLTTGFKDSRKAAKSYWYLIKTFLEVTEIKNGIPEWLQVTANDFATRWYGQELKVLGRANNAIRVFDPAVVKNLKKQSTGSMPHLRFYAFLEGLNVALATSDLLHAKSDEERLKKGVALSGALGSLASALIDIEKTMIKDWGKATNSATNRSPPIPQLLRKAGAARMTTKVLSGVGSLADTVLGVWAITQDLETHDQQVVKFHAAQAFGGILGVAGYVMMATGFGVPVGALMVFLGSGFGFGGSLFGNLFRSTDIEHWAKFCRWGILAGKDGYGEEVTAWAEGVPKELYLQTGKQIRTLNTLLVGLSVDVTMVYSPMHSEAEVEVHVAMCADDGTIDLELIIEGVTVRKMSTWKRGKDRDQSGKVREKFPLGTGANTTVRVRVKPFPEVPYQVPSDKALQKTVVLAPPKGTLANPYLGRAY